MNHVLFLMIVAASLALSGCAYTGCMVEVGSEETEVCIDFARSSDFCERELNGGGIESDPPAYEEGIICRGFGYEVECDGSIQRRGTPGLSFGYWAQSQADCEEARDGEIVVD